jgi:hypothetical protein
LPDDRLVALNSGNLQKVTCGRYTAYYFGKSNLRVSKILGVDESLAWTGCDLPTIVGKANEQCILSKRTNNEEGFLSFGPYQELLPGRYEFEIRYASDALETYIAGSWDVSVAMSDRAKVINHGELKGSGGQPARLTNTFSLTSEGGNEPQKVEIRTFSIGGIQMSIAGLKIRRLD